MSRLSEFWLGWACGTIGNALHSLLGALIAVQVATFVGVGILLIIEGDWRLGFAQLLLAGVQGLVYA